MMKAMARPYRNSFLIASISILVSALVIVTADANRPSAALPVTTQAAESTFYLPRVNNGGDPWSMPGANAERTSWVPEQVDGSLTPLWFKKFEPYIPAKVQIITAYNTLYISTSAGLYALDADSGAEKWVYPTEMPLGHSPTIHQGVAYVGGFDRRLHAVNAHTGEGLWTFTAGSGFDTNPLIISGIAYLGNRDGYFYAIHTQGALAGQLAWRYKTGGPINYSAAYKDGVLYFASNDSYAYALDAKTGSLKWKSSKLPGLGFQSWWPVVYGDWVIFSGTTGYRPNITPGFVSNFPTVELHEIYPNYSTDPRGTPVGPIEQQSGDWVPKTCTIDTSRPNITSNGSTLPVTEYLEAKPWRRTYFVLNRFTGKEYTTDFDNDGKPEYAPILWQGTHSGNRYPPVVGSDGVIYQSSNYMSDRWIAGGQVVGWQIGTPYISVPSIKWIAVDEPFAYSGGGDRIYWNHCCDRGAGSFDISIPNPEFPMGWLPTEYGPCSDAPFVRTRDILYFQYNLNSIIPDYGSSQYPVSGRVLSVFGGQNGVYGSHGNQNPPIPYHGKLYMHRSNALIAFAPNVGEPVELPMAVTVPPPVTTVPAPTLDQVRERLAQEVKIMIDAGHLLPAYYNAGSVTYVPSKDCGYNNKYAIGDFYHNPAETIYTLIRALPYLESDLQTQTKAYIQSEFNAFPLYEVKHIGWLDGVDRVIFDIPPDVIADRPNFPPLSQDINFPGWTYDPFGFYAMWQYAEIFGGARELYDASNSRLNRVPPSDDYLTTNVQVLNSYIAGYDGYLKLEALAGYPTSKDIQDQLIRLQELRARTFTKDTPDSDADALSDYCRGLNISRNFFYLTPELGQYLHDHALPKVEAAVDEYSLAAPYWFVAGFDATFGEGVNSLLYYYHSLFQAKALILNEPWEELAKYIDEPAVPIGDLYYIDNLISTLQAAGQQHTSFTFSRTDGNANETAILPQVAGECPSLAMQVGGTHCLWQYSLGSRKISRDTGKCTPISQSLRSSPLKIYTRYLENTERTMADMTPGSSYRRAFHKIGAGFCFS